MRFRIMAIASLLFVSASVGAYTAGYSDGSFTGVCATPSPPTICVVGATNLGQATPSGFQSFGFGTTMVYNDDGTIPLTHSQFSVSGLATHTSVSLGFLLAIIDSWDGSSTSFGPDYLNIAVDGTTIFSETFSNFGGPQSASTANRITSGTDLGFNTWNDSVYDFTGSNGFLSIPHTGSSIQVTWFAGGAGWQGGTDESFGLDQIQLSFDGVPVPEPGTLALLGLGLAGLGLSRRRKTH